MTHKKNPSKIVFAKTTIEGIDFMSHYTHFSIDEREKILFYLAQSKSLGFIAKEINKSKSSFLEILSEIQKQLVHTLLAMLK